MKTYNLREEIVKKANLAFAKAFRLTLLEAIMNRERDLDPPEDNNKDSWINDNIDTNMKAFIENEDNFSFIQDILNDTERYRDYEDMEYERFLING